MTNRYFGLTFEVDGHEILLYVRLVPLEIIRGRCTSDSKKRKKKKKKKSHQTERVASLLIVIECLVGNGVCLTWMMDLIRFTRVPPPPSQLIIQAAVNPYLWSDIMHLRRARVIRKSLNAFGLLLLLPRRELGGAREVPVYWPNDHCAALNACARPTVPYFVLARRR